MIELAQTSAEGHTELEGLAALPDEEAVARLCRLARCGALVGGIRHAPPPGTDTHFSGR